MTRIGGGKMSGARTCRRTPICKWAGITNATSRVVKLCDEEKKIERNSKSNNIISFQQQQEVKEATKRGPGEVKGRDGSRTRTVGD